MPDLLSNLSILLSLYTYFWYEFKLFWKVAMCCQLSSVDKLLENCENIFGHCWLMDSQFMGHDHPTTLGSRTPSPNCFFCHCLVGGCYTSKRNNDPPVKHLSFWTSSTYKNPPFYGEVTISAELSTQIFVGWLASTTLAELGSWDLFRSKRKLIETGTKSARFGGWS